MSSVKARRRRGTATDVVGIYVTVAPDVKDKFDAMAEATGTSKWHVLETLIRDIEVDGHGKPRDWPVSADHQEELPVTSA